MKYLTKENVILAFVVFLSLNVFLGIGTEKNTNLEYEIKLRELEYENMLQLKKNNQLEFKIKKFQNEKSKIDSTVSNYSPNQVDSFFTDFFK